MPTAVQIRKAVKPLLQRHADLVLVGRVIYVRPIRHLSRAILLDRTSDPNRIDATYDANLLCNWVRTNWRRDLTHAPPLPNIWLWNDDSMPDSLLDAIEQQALPVLRAISTFDDVQTFTLGEPRGWTIDNDRYTGMLFYAAAGCLEHAQQAARALRNAWPDAKPVKWPLLQRQVELLRATRDFILDDDWRAVAQALHDLERNVVMQWKLEPYWEPSPFPLEHQI